MIGDGNILILSCLLALYSIFFIELIFWREQKPRPEACTPVHSQHIQKMIVNNIPSILKYPIKRFRNKRITTLTKIM